MPGETILKTERTQPKPRPRHPELQDPRTSSLPRPGPAPETLTRGHGSAHRAALSKCPTRGRHNQPASVRRRRDSAGGTPVRLTTPRGLLLLPALLGVCGSHLPTPLILAFRITRLLPSKVREPGAGGGAPREPSACRA